MYQILVCLVCTKTIWFYIFMLIWHIFCFFCICYINVEVRIKCRLIFMSVEKAYPRTDSRRVGVINIRMYQCISVYNMLNPTAWVQNHFKHMSSVAWLLILWHDNVRQAVPCLTWRRIHYLHPMNVKELYRWNQLALLWKWGLDTFEQTLRGCQTGIW